ncbi:MAG: exosortase H [Myxococcota bacterium]
MTSRPDSRGAIARFLAVLAACMGVFYAVATTETFERRVFEPYLERSARIAGAILAALGERDVRVRSSSVESLAYGLNIARGCDGLEPTALFVALVLAFPAPFRRKLWALGFGVPALVALNLVRVVSLFLIGAYHPSLFHPMHVDVWQAVFVLTAVGFWATWLRWAGPPGPADAPA